MEQFKMVNARDGGAWTVKQVRVAKDTTWRTTIGQRVMEVGNAKKKTASSTCYMPNLIPK
jgi:hypothetical protein